MTKKELKILNKESIKYLIDHGFEEFEHFQGYRSFKYKDLGLLHLNIETQKWTGGLNVNVPNIMFDINYYNEPLNLIYALDNYTDEIMKELLLNKTKAIEECDNFIKKYLNVWSNIKNNYV